MMKLNFHFLSVLLFLVGSFEGWERVEREEKVVHQLVEDDPSVWVVFAKKFDSERILIRFPEAPIATWEKGRYKAVALLGEGELTMTVEKKVEPGFTPQTIKKERFYHDPETSLKVLERQIETELHLYTLSFKHDFESAAASQTFFDSFEIERAGDFIRA